MKIKIYLKIKKEKKEAGNNKKGKKKVKEPRHGKV
jgi:hypothetical protein